MGYPMSKPKLWKKIAKIVIFVLILTLIIFYFIATRYGFQTKVQKTIPALELSVATKENPTKTKITIDGTYTNYLLPREEKDFLFFTRKQHLNFFDGRISIASHEETQEKELFFPLSFREGSGMLTYVKKGTNNYLDLGTTFGTILTTKNLEQLIILIMEQKDDGGYWNATTGSFLIAPATTKEEIIEIFNGYLKEFPNSDYASHIEYLKHDLFQESMAEETKS